MSRKKATPSFEQSLSQLTEVVEKMEQGNLPLDQALAAFEEGILLTRSCQSALAEAEQKVSILLSGKDQTAVEQSFAAEPEA